MFNFFKSRKNSKKASVSTVSYEPEFLNEYIVTVGRNATYVYARSRDEARSMVVGDIKNDTPYYDSEYLRTRGLKEARTHLHGEVKVCFNGVSTRKNPAYSG